ncbi:MAG: UDP-N-acetylglucosamine pyrophosphorylase [Planctomycetota bacterium]|nr:MAG: UDP-N-acetylglucosamine pyrophosphorylase [Planctomycetota bacterium]
MTTTTQTTAVILAAGKGTRMGSDLAKVLHPLQGKPLVQHVIGHCHHAAIDDVVCVVGHQRQAVAAVVQPLGARCVVQDQQLGTGHAVLVSEESVRGDTVVVLCGDAPLIDGALLRRLLEQHQQRKASATAVAAHMPDPSGYGRMITDAQGNLQHIVEQRDATPEQAAITLINSGIFAFRRDRLFALLHELRPENAQGEYYLTDIPKMLAAAGETVAMIVADDPTCVLGINTPQQLREAEAILAARG